jgi:hypothetical protein
MPGTAADMDVHVMERDTLYQMLIHCLPSGRLDQVSGKGNRVRAGYHISVSRVLCRSGLPKGLYFLVRIEEHFDALQHAMRQDFEWVRPEGCPDAADGLPLYKLIEGFVMQIPSFEVYGDSVQLYAFVAN